jgi:hypothetical protein
MRYRIVVVGAALALVMACDQGTSIAGPKMQPAVQPAFDATVSKTNEQDVLWAVEEENPCNGDMVTAQGSTHYVFGFLFDDTGGSHISTRVNSKGSGIGLPSGSSYRVSDESTYSEQNPEGDQFTIRQERMVRMLGDRQVDNYTRHMVFKLTQNANGVPTASFERSWTKCDGMTL